MLMDPHPSQQSAVWRLQQEVTRPEKSGVDGGASQVPTYCKTVFGMYI